MKVTIISEYGYKEAMMGLSLSRNQPLENMYEVSMKLYDKDGAHNKFLESISVWLDVVAPRYFWQQLDTYRVGVSKQSESTMYSLMKKSSFTKNDFEGDIPIKILSELQYLLKNKDFETLKSSLPEGFLQRRIVRTDYLTLRRIVKQRKYHRLREWKYFCDEILTQIEFRTYFEDLK